MIYPPAFLETLALEDIIENLDFIQERERFPPYLPTLALLGALQNHGYPCALWNAVLVAPNQRRVVAGIKAQSALLDIHGEDPHHYPQLYPLFEGGRIEMPAEHEIIPGRQEQACSKLPHIAPLCHKTLQRLWLAHNTATSAGSDSLLRRL